MSGLFVKNALKGSVGIVTGAGRGLGKAMALALAGCGCDLALTARHPDEIDRVAEEVAAHGVKALTVIADVTRADDLERMAERVVAEFGKIDVLINNAGQNGSYVHHDFENIPENEWRGMLEANVTGVFLASKIVGRRMLDQRRGKIINVSSSFGVMAVPTRICYCVTKAAVIHLTRCLAVEWADRGVTVNCIAPGSIDLFPDSTDEAHRKLNMERVKRIPLGRLGRMEDLGPLVVYLASPAADYMTGEVLFFDGGLAAM